MIDLEKIVELLDKVNLSAVSKETGIFYSQLWKIKSGKNKNPTYNVMKLLNNYFSCRMPYDDDLKESGKTYIYQTVSQIIDEMDPKEFMNGDLRKSVGVHLLRAGK